MRRGEIYSVDLGPSVGREPGGVCPVVVVSADVYNLYPVVVIVVLGADAASVAPTAGVIVPASASGAPTDLVFLRNQIRSLDPSRFTTGAIGTVPATALEQVIARLKSYLDIN